MLFGGAKAEPYGGIRAGTCRALLDEVLALDSPPPGDTATLLLVPFGHVPAPVTRSLCRFTASYAH
jgi:hypothetical protein